jgi:hypothetical protein
MSIWDKCKKGSIGGNSQKRALPLTPLTVYLKLHTKVKVFHPHIDTITK